MPNKARFADDDYEEQQPSAVKPPSPIKVSKPQPSFPQLPVVAPGSPTPHNDGSMTDSNQSMDMEMDSGDEEEGGQQQVNESKQDDILISFDSPLKKVPQLYPEIPPADSPIQETEKLATESSPRRLSFPSIFKNNSNNKPPRDSIQGRGQQEEENQTMDFTEIPNNTVQEEEEQTMDFTQVPNRGNEEEEQEQTMEFTQVQNSGYPGEEDEEDNEEEETMEFTRIQNRGHLEEDEQTMEFTKPLGSLNNVPHYEEEEQTMDFTRSYGGNAYNQDEQTMEMTRTIGAIQEYPEDNEEDDERTMEMTQSLGQIRSIPMEEDENEEQTMELTRPLQQQQQKTVNDTEQTMEFTQPVRMETLQEVADDDEKTMEFTRPMQSNVSKQYEESSSEEALIPQPKTPPKKSPRKSKSPVKKSTQSPFQGFEETPVQTQKKKTPSPNKKKRTASPTKSPGNKRAKVAEVADEVSTTPVKQMTPSAVNMPPPSSQRTPSQALKDQIQSLTPRRNSAKRRSPSKQSPTSERKKKTLSLPLESEKVSYTPLRSVKKGEVPNTIDVARPASPTPSKKGSQDLSRSLPAISGDVNEYQNVSLQDFLNMISIDFMDDFLTNTRGHSSFGISHEASSQDPTFSDYVVAAQKFPLVELYDFSIREMKNNVKDAKELFKQLETETLEENPLLFREYIEASADTKQLMNAQFKLVKSYARQQAKSVWYDWRSQLTTGVHEAFLKNFKSLQDDEKMMNKRKPEVEQSYNDISSKYKEMKNKLERMRKRSTELANCDRGQLISAQERLTSRKKELFSVQKSLEEKTNQVRDYRELVETQLQHKRKLQDSIQAAEKIRQANKQIDMQDIFDLRDKFIMIQKCQGFENCKLIDGNILQLILYQTLKVQIDLKTKHIITEPIYGKNEDDGQKLCLDFLNRQAQGYLYGNNEPLSEKLSELRTLWQRASCLNRDIKLYRLQQITTVSEDKIDNEPVLKLSTRLFTENPVPSKMYVKIRIKGSSLAIYPERLEGNITVSVVYGDQWIDNMTETCNNLDKSLSQGGLQGVFSKFIELTE